MISLLSRRRRVHDDTAVVGALRVAEPGRMPRRRTRPGDVLALDVPHLDRARAEELLLRRPAAVLLAGPAVSWRYPHRGPELLLDAGVTVVDLLGPRLLDTVRDGTTVHVRDGRVRVGEGRDRWVDTHPPLQGVEQDHDSVAAALEGAARGMVARLEEFAEGTAAVLVAERDLLLEGAGIPDVPVDLAGRTVLVCVRGYGWAEDLRLLRRFVTERRPVLVGVDGGADALLEVGLRPDLVVVGDRQDDPDPFAQLGRDAQDRDDLHRDDLHGGDLDRDDLHGADQDPGVASRAAVSCGAHVVVRCPPGRLETEPRDRPAAPGETRFPSGLSSEDTAILLAHGHGAASIVTVGSHATLEEFLDRGRAGSASSFLTRLRAGTVLVDAATVARLHQPRRSWALVVLLVLAALTTVLSVTAATPWGQDQLAQVAEAARSWPVTGSLTETLGGLLPAG